MDDSERSYGYSKDIYHGREGTKGHEESYETQGAEEGPSQTRDDEPSPLEEAMHLEQARTGGDQDEDLGLDPVDDEPDRQAPELETAQELDTALELGVSEEAEASAEVENVPADLDDRKKKMAESR